MRKHSRISPLLLLLLAAGCDPSQPLPNPQSELDVTGQTSGSDYPDGSYVPFEDRVVIVHGTVTDTDPLNTPDSWDGYVTIVRNKSEEYILSAAELTKVPETEDRWEFYRAVRLYSGWNSLEIYVAAFPGGVILEYSPELELQGDWSTSQEPLVCSLEWPETDAANLDLHTIDDLGRDCSEDDADIGGMHLDIPDSWGYGPEYITVTNTRQATYTVAVRYAAANGVATPVNCVVHVYLRGAELSSSPYRHTFSPDDEGQDPWVAVEVNYNP